MLLWIEINAKINNQSDIHIPIVISYQENAVNKLINSKLKKKIGHEKNSQSLKFNFINNQTNSQ